MRSIRFLQIGVLNFALCGMAAILPPPADVVSHAETPDEDAVTVMGGDNAICTSFARLRLYTACNYQGCVATNAYQAGSDTDIWYTYKYATANPCPTPLGGGDCSAVYYGDFKGCSANPLP